MSNTSITCDYCQQPAQRRADDIRAAAQEIARFIESTTTLAVGQPMINAIETIIHETCFRTVSVATDNLCPEHRTEFKLFEVGGCIKCWRDSEVENALSERKPAAEN